MKENTTISSVGAGAIPQPMGGDEEKREFSIDFLADKNSITHWAESLGLDPTPFAKLVESNYVVAPGAGERGTSWFTWRAKDYGDSYNVQDGYDSEHPTWAQAVGYAKQHGQYLGTHRRNPIDHGHYISKEEIYESGETFEPKSGTPLDDNMEWWDGT